MNNRGWIRIVEAFFSVMLIAGVLLIVLNNGSLTGDNISAKVYDLQLSVLREIELDDGLRLDILTAEEEGCNGCENPIPNGIEDKNSNGDDNSNFPNNVRKRIIDRMPKSLICESKICKIDVICELDKYIDKDVYAKSVAIAATIETYSPRQLKMFCWNA